MTHRFWGKFDPTKLQISSCGRFLVSIASLQRRDAIAAQVRAPQVLTHEQDHVDVDAVNLVASQRPGPGFVEVANKGNATPGRVELTIRAYVAACSDRGGEASAGTSPRVERALQSYLAAKAEQSETPAVSSRVERALQDYVKSR